MGPLGVLVVSNTVVPAVAISCRLPVEGNRGKLFELLPGLQAYLVQVRCTQVMFSDGIGYDET